MSEAYEGEWRERILTMAIYKGSKSMRHKKTNAYALVIIVTF